MLMWCLKQLKYFILQFSIGGGFFVGKEFLNLYTMTLVLFPVSGFFDEVVDNQTNYQEDKYVYLLQYHTLTSIHFMNGEGVC